MRLIVGRQAGGKMNESTALSPRSCEGATYSERMRSICETDVAALSPRAERLMRLIVGRQAGGKMNESTALSPRSYEGATYGAQSALISGS